MRVYRCAALPHQVLVAFDYATLPSICLVIVIIIITVNKLVCWTHDEVCYSCLVWVLGESYLIANLGLEMLFSPQSREYVLGTRADRTCFSIGIAIKQITMNDREEAGNVFLTSCTYTVPTYPFPQKPDQEGAGNNK